MPLLGYWQLGRFVKVALLAALPPLLYSTRSAHSASGKDWQDDGYDSPEGFRICSHDGRGATDAPI